MPSEVAPGVHRLGSEIVNWYLVRDGDRLTAVDSGLPRFRDGLESDLAALGALPGGVEAVVLTHSDSDHTGLAPALRDAGARVLIHSEDEASLAKPGPKKGDASPAHLVPLLVQRRGDLRRRRCARRSGPPQGDRDAGAQRGHSALLFEEHGALFVGDELCTWNPLTGVRKPQLMPRQFNESNPACRDSLAALEGLNAGVVLRGHGEPWTGGPAAAVASARALL